mgnify:CR=1 FL=1
MDPHFPDRTPDRADRTGGHAGDDLDRPPAGHEALLGLDSPEVPRLAFAAAVVGFVALIVGSLFGQATTQLAITATVVLAVAAAARMLPSTWWGHVAGFGTAASLGLLLLL